MASIAGRIIGQGLIEGGKALMRWLAPAAAGAGAGAVVVNEMTKAEQEAQQVQSQAPATTTTVTCATCKDNPCAHLANPPTVGYQGGAHGATKLPWGDGKDSHHLPPNASYGLPSDVKPAIQMDAADHQQTSSYRNPLYVAQQRALIASGGFAAAMAQDIAEIRAKFPNKYETAIIQMQAYAACLKRHGLLP